MPCGVVLAVGAPADLVRRRIRSPDVSEIEDANVATLREQELRAVPHQAVGVAGGGAEVGLRRRLDQEDVLILLRIEIDERNAREGVVAERMRSAAVPARGDDATVG